MSKKLLFGILIIFLINLFTGFHAYGAKYPAPGLQADSAILVETRRGQVLFEKQPDKKLHISVANKIMTAIIALENTSLDSKVTISKQSAGTEGSSLNLEIGGKYPVEELLYALLLTSANDVANALAEYVGGDIEKFVSMMNNKAYELNMKNTHFGNPTGLYDETQYTTAYDMSLLLRYALNNTKFNTIFSTKLIPWNTNNNLQVLTNQNKLFWSYENIDGGKIGYNSKDKQTAITTATRNDQRLISIVLDSPEASVLTDSESLLDYGFKNFKLGLLASKYISLETIQVADKSIELVPLNDVYYTYPINEDYIKSSELNIAKDLKPPINKNQMVGTLKYTLMDNTVIEISLYPKTELTLPENFYMQAVKKLFQNKDILILLGFLVFVEAMLIIFNIIKLIRKLLSKKYKV